MSRRHPTLSVKYYNKLMTRSRRTKEREILQETKIAILERHGIKYSDITKKANCKQVVKRCIEENRYEYKSLLNENKKRMRIDS